MKKILTAILAGFSLMALVSCKSEIVLTAQKDGSVEVSFNGECGEFFQSMLKTFSEGENGPLFDVSGIKQSFYTDGFKNVAVQAPSDVALKTSFIAPKNTFLFTSGLLLESKNHVVVRVSPEILMNFYKSADAEIVNVLDLLIAPVFNDEEMTDEEYLETIGSFYGEGAIKEIGTSNISLTCISAAGEKQQFEVPLTKLLTLAKGTSLFYSSGL